MSLPRSMRFQNRREVYHVLREGKRFITPIGRVLFLPATDGKGRILFRITSRVSKRASTRHLLKRRLDNWAILHRNLIPRYHLVVLVDPPALEITTHELIKQADTLLDRLNTRK